jgi:hypothetical protein
LQERRERSGADYGDWEPPLIPLLPPLNNKKNPNIVVIYDGSDDGAGHPTWATGKEFTCAAKWIIGPRRPINPIDISAKQAIDVLSWRDALQKLYSFATAHGTIDVLYVVDHSHDGRQQVGNDNLTPADFAYLRPLLARKARIILLGCSVADDRPYLQEVANKTGATVAAYRKIVEYAGECPEVDRPFWPKGTDPKEVGEKDLVEIGPEPMYR